METTTNETKSELWQEIFWIVCQIPRREVDGDCMDASSASTQIEKLIISKSAPLATDNAKNMEKIAKEIMKSLTIGQVSSEDIKIVEDILIKYFDYPKEAILTCDGRIVNGRCDKCYQPAQTSSSYCLRLIEAPTVATDNTLPPQTMKEEAEQRYEQVLKMLPQEGAEELFCKIYSTEYGESVDSIYQIKIDTFDGLELLTLCQKYAQQEREKVIQECIDEVIQSCKDEVGDEYRYDWDALSKMITQRLLKK